MCRDREVQGGGPIRAGIESTALTQTPSSKARRVVRVAALLAPNHIECSQAPPNMNFDTIRGGQTHGIVQTALMRRVETVVSRAYCTS